MSFQGDLVWRCLFCAQDASDTEMAHARVDHLWLAGRGTVTQTIVRSTQVGTTFDDSAGNAELGLPRVVALFKRTNARVHSGAAACLRDFIGMVVHVPV